MTSDHISESLTEDIVATRCSTMTLDGINSAITYVIWHEEHLCNVSVLGRVHLSDIVSVPKDHYRVRDFSTLAPVWSHRIEVHPISPIPGSVIVLLSCPTPAIASGLSPSACPAA
jgi:hypothetical protein